MKRLFFVILFLTFSCVGFSQTKIPTLKRYITDYTGTLNSAQLNAIEKELKAFDDSTSNQIVVLMITSLNGYPMEKFTYEVAVKNKIGSKEHDNGVLLFIAKEDRKMRIEVGYGLEGALPDALASSILRNEIRPYFKNGEYFQGVRNGIYAVESSIKGEYTAEDTTDDNGGGGQFVSFFIFLIIFILSFFRRRGRGGAIYVGGFGGGRGGFGGGGGFSSGGFSGGGGSFGGGGASGGW
ncbi:MAG: methanol dehydrogenase [Chlorobi bacterium]|nr:methanol dehydrogenase [Chlorobiota bacterium]